MQTGREESCSEGKVEWAEETDRAVLPETQLIYMLQEMGFIEIYHLARVCLGPELPLLFFLQ